MARAKGSDAQPLTSSQPLQGEVHPEGAYMAPSSAPYPQIYYADPYGNSSYQAYPAGHLITPYAGHPAAHGRIAMPLHAGMHRSPAEYEEYEFPPYMTEEEATPYLQVPVERYTPMRHSPSMGHYSHPISPTEQLSLDQHQLQRSHSMPQMNHPQPFVLQRPQRPKLQSSQSMIVQRPSVQTQDQRPGMTRHASLCPPSRSASPFVAGDVFDHVPGQHVEEQMYRPVQPQDSSWELSAFEDHYGNGQGISPARALGPAPTHPHRFSPGGPNDDLMITPQPNRTTYSDHPPSSAISTAPSTSSNYSNVIPRKRQDFDSSDDESGEQGGSMLPARTMKTRGGETKAPTSPLAVAKPLPKAPVRTSAKLAKVAEDPGVEGIPPGPRSHERPGPSFACIIGQAILSCKAGGLSLEHIYRYVETAYPFFKSGDNAWRNSVRHNLSIHKMFETVARTEKFPPGKGGIWIIHDDEKCHWPSPDKFIKNFPPGHSHHDVCRQTRHERAKEKEAMEKAAREGKIYVPKKGKKRRKALMKDELDMREMASLPQEIEMVQGASSLQMEEVIEKTPEPVEIPERKSGGLDRTALPESANRIESIKTQKENEKWALPPPPSDCKGKRKLLLDEDSLFTTTKRVRMAEPLAPIFPYPQETVPGRIEKLDSSFITPERERPIPNGKQFLSSSSDFKTPALVQSSSSPGSPPMPSTITRSTHHPSALQQAWTHDDMSQTPPRDSSPAMPMLDAAFDLKPKPLRPRLEPVEEDFIPPAALASPPHRGPPKTPVTRSSAAADKSQTPRLHHKRNLSMSAVTPMVYRGSPGMPPPTASALLSTPMWEIGGCLDRLKDHFGSPTQTPIRSTAPPTSPTRYAMMLLDQNGSPRREKGVR